MTTPNSVVSIIATEPLTTDEQWDIYQQLAGEIMGAGVKSLPAANA